MNSVSMFN